MSEKDLNVDIELQNRVLEAMFVFSDLGGGVIKSTIPDKIFLGEQKVKINGEEYDIYGIPGLEEGHGGSRIIEHAIDSFIKGHGAPSWSQVVNEAVQESSFNQIVSYPKTVYLKK